MTIRHVLSCLLTSVLAFWVSACAAPEEDLVIINARVFSGVGAETADNMSIAIKGDRIESISAGPVDTAGAVVIDARGRTVLPGLIDTHTHLFFDLQQGVSFPTSDGEAEAFIQNQIRRTLLDYLQHGFTTVVSALDFWPEILRVRDALNREELTGPRLFVAGGALMAPGPHYICGRLQGEAAAWCNAHMAAQAGTADEARSAVARYAASGVDLIVYDSVTNATTVDPAVAGALVEAAHAAGLRVLLHNADTQGFDVLVRAGVDGFLHPPAASLDASSRQWTLIQPDSVRAGLILGVTTGETEEAIRAGALNSEQRAEHDATLRNIRVLLDRGATPVFASDIPGAPVARIMPIVFRSLTDLGLSNADVLRASTRDAANVVGRGTDLGSLERGKIADILIVRGDPLRDLTALGEVDLVIKGGKIAVDNRPGQNR